MKKFFLFLLGLFLSLPTNLQAQSKDKGFFVEGSVSYASDRQSKVFTDEFSIITPAVGYQFNDKWSAGVKISFSTSDDFRFNWFSSTPFVRYNFCSLGKANLFTEGKISGYLFPDPGEGRKDDPHFIEAGFSLGVSYPFNEHLKLVCQYLHIGYSNEYRDSNKRCSKHGLNLHSGDWVLDANIKRLSIGLSWTF